MPPSPDPRTDATVGRRADKAEIDGMDETDGMHETDAMADTALLARVLAEGLREHLKATIDVDIAPAAPRRWVPRRWRAPSPTATRCGWPRPLRS